MSIFLPSSPDRAWHLLICLASTCQMYQWTLSRPWHMATSSDRDRSMPCHLSRACNSTHRTSLRMAAADPSLRLIPPTYNAFVRSSSSGGPFPPTPRGSRHNTKHCGPGVYGRMIFLISIPHDSHCTLVSLLTITLHGIYREQVFSRFTTYSTPTLLITAVPLGTNRACIWGFPELRPLRLPPLRFPLLSSEADKDRQALCVLS